MNRVNSTITKAAKAALNWLGILLVVFTAQSGWAEYEEVIYYHNDALGSPVMATDASGNVKWEEDYMPFGKRLEYQSQELVNGEPREDAWDETVWYTGHQEETRLGLVYMGARWYDPSIGRFMAMDPVGVDPKNVFSFNRYSYANNNPYKYIDPDGREVRLNWHVVRIGISTGKNHSLLTITPNNPEHFNNARRVSSIGSLTNTSGEKYGTMGAGPNAVWNLESNYNRESDVKEHSGGIVISPPNGESEEVFVDKLIALDRNYKDQLDYSFNPDGMDNFNSNSYVSGLLNASGVDTSKISIPNAPGWDKPVPKESFGEK